MELTKSQLILGDNLEILPTLPDKFFNLLLADPPYNISRESNIHTMNRAGLDFGEWDKNFDQITWIKLAIPKLKPGANIVIWNDWKELGNICRCLTTELNLHPEKSLRPLIWHKTNPRPLNCRSVFIQSTEFAVWTTVPGAKATFNSPYHHGVFNYSINKTAAHPTKKQDGLFEEIINLLSNPGDWILDPFAGGGTTCFAAEKTGRNFLAIEKDKSYYNTAFSHWRKACDN